MASDHGGSKGAGWYRPLVGAALSALIPGAGQWYGGRRRRAVWFFGIAVGIGLPAATLLILIFYAEGVDLAITLSRPFFEQPSLLLVLLVLNGLLLLFRLVCVVDAFLIPVRDGRGGASPWVVLGSVVVLAFLVTPHGWAAERNLALYDLFTYDFTADPGQVTVTTAPPATAPPATTRPPSATTEVPQSSTSMPPTTMPATTTSTTTTTMPDPFADYERINVLLLGGDSGVGRWGVRTDTMIVVSVDPTTGSTAMFSIPRNTVWVPVPESMPAYHRHWCHCYTGPANAIYQRGLLYPEDYPGGPNTGGNAVKALLGELLGLDIHYFALVDLQGFVDIVDAIGGVTITVTERIYEPYYPHEDGTRERVEIQPGTYEMDGHLALVYARSRRQSDDYVRMGRQRCVVEAIAEQADPIGLLRALPDLVPAIQGSVVTDIRISAIPDFLDLLSRADLETVPSVRFMWLAPELEGTGTSYVAGFEEAGYPRPNLPLIRETVQTVLSLPPAEAIELLDLEPLEEVCG